MSRIIHTENPTKIRNQNRRSIAEILRRLSQQGQLNDETKDMAAMLVYLLREIHEGVQQSAQAWEKRDYWLKAERFMREWAWTGETAANLDDVLRHDAWDLLPDLMADLLPRFADIQLKTMTRSADLWRGAHARLMADSPLELPW
ncbi:MAG: hypothetical protein IAE79_24810 [Anaerolinea sp.]|nr:hypothetical protein [Anaerolinea sp.]